MNLLEILVDLSPKAVSLGLLQCLSVIGFALTLRLLSYPDLAVEGTFVFGGAIATVLLTHGYSSVLTLPVAAMSCGMVGLFTASLHCFFRINRLLTGIISLSILYSLNLRLIGANQSLRGLNTIFAFYESRLFVAVLCVAPVIVCLILILYSKYGLFLRTCGENSKVVSRSGLSTKFFVLTGMILGNSLIGMSGAIFSQAYGACDISHGAGMIITCLTSLVIGEIIFRPSHVYSFVLSIVAGTIVTQMIYALCLRININPNDYKGVVAFILILLIIGRERFLKGTHITFGSEVFR